MSNLNISEKIQFAYLQTPPHIRSFAKKGLYYQTRSLVSCYKLVRLAQI